LPSNFDELRNEPGYGQWASEEHRLIRGITREYVEPGKVLERYHSDVEMVE